MGDEEFGAFESARRLWLGFLLVLVAVLGVSFAAPGPSPRRYPDRIEVRFWHMWTGDWEKVVDRICDRFNESQTTYEVVPLSVPGDTADSKFLIAVAGANPPDCMAQWNDVIPKWAESKLLLPLDGLMAPSEWDHQRRSIFPAALRIGSYRDHLYGLTVGLNVWALYYRPDYFRQAGLDPDHLPATLEGLARWASQMDQTDAAAGALVRVGMLPWGLRNFAPVFGGGLYDWGRGSLTVDTPANLRALDWLVRQRERLGFDRVARFEASQHAARGGQGDWPLLSGSMAITLDGQWRVQEAQRYAPGFDYRTAPVPPAAGGLSQAGFCNGNFMVVPASARHPEGAWAFIKFWSGLEQPARAAEFYTWGGWLPLNREVRSAPVYQAYVDQHPQFRTFVDLLESPNLYPIPPVPYQVYLSDRVLRMEQAACMGSSTPREAMDQLVKDMDRELAHRREDGYAN